MQDLASDARGSQRGPTAFDVPRAVPVTFVMLAGVTLTALLTWLVHQRVTSDRNRRLSELAGHRVAALQFELNNQLDALRGIADYFASSEHVTQVEFRRFVRGTLDRSPGVLSFQWLPSVTAAERAAHEAEQRAEGLESYALLEFGEQGSLLRASDRGEYFPIALAEHANAGLEAQHLLGLDHGRDPEWRTALERARLEGCSVATHPRVIEAGETALLGERSRGAPVLSLHVYHPVYSGTEIPTTLEGRTSSLLGFACAVIDVEGLLNQALLSLSATVLKLWIYPSSTAPPGSAIFTNDRGSDPDFEREGLVHALEFATRNWSVRAREGSELFDQDALSWDWVMGIAGAVATGLAGVLAHRALDARRRLRSELDSFWKLSADMLCVADASGMLVRVNPAWQRMLGYREDELYARPFLSFVHPEDRQVTRAETGRVARGRGSAVFTNRFRAQDGSYRWFSWQAVPGGAPHTIYAVARDVTEERGAYREMERMASTDGLTGLLNRRAWLTRLRQEVARARRYHQPLCLALLDVDHFKEVNDSHGHAVGDELLRRTVGVLLDNLRETDVAGRLGGDEFVVLFVQTEHAQAARVAARWREKLLADGGLRIPGGSSLRATLSIGLASLTEDVSGPDDLLRRADEALYRAKQAGRDRLASY